MPPSPTEPPLVLNARVRYRDIGGDGVLVHLEHGRVIVVNDVGLFIIQELRTPTTRSRLAAAIAAEFEVTVERARADLESFLSALDAERVLERSV